MHFLDRIPELDQVEVDFEILVDFSCQLAQSVFPVHNESLIPLNEKNLNVPNISKDTNVNYQHFLCCIARVVE